jgi:hypothetical protein
VVVFAVSLLGGVVGTVAIQKKRAFFRMSDEYTALAWNGAAAEVDQDQEGLLRLRSGEVALSTWGRPWTVDARGHVVKVEQGVVVVRLAGDSVVAEAVEGSFTFDGETHVAKGGTAPSPLVKAVLALESEGARARRLVQRAEQSVTEQRFADAVKDLEVVASSGTLDAEVANFKKAELELRQLGQPAVALQTLEAGEARFPSGALTQERRLSALESLVKLERWADVERNSTDFLSRFADSERAAEVRRLREDAQRRLRESP